MKGTIGSNTATEVVVLAGGKGTRLAPYTTTVPKPLMPVGEYPILEILLRQLAAQGFQSVTLAVGHLAGLIQAYFGDGSDIGLKLSYAYESRPLGTAGPLARLPRSDASILVLNGDLLTDLDFTDLVRFHRGRNAAATVGMTRRHFPVEFGVIEANDDGRIVGFREKPELDYLVSMGVYMFAPHALDYIPRGSAFDFPELLSCLLAQGEVVAGYRSTAYWMDIGRPADYEKANRDFPEMENSFLAPRMEKPPFRAAV
jgi:NDP-sugar pyrophosphorylase family protein